MGFTIEDMLVVGSDRYRMELAAGRQGWSNSISWVLLLEDLTIIQDFSGKELAVTTGLGFRDESSMLRLVQELAAHNASGLIVNTGYYVMDLPASVIAYCDENDLPLLTVPWEIYLADLIKHLSIRIFLQGDTVRQTLSDRTVSCHTNLYFRHCIVSPSFKMFWFFIPRRSCRHTCFRRSIRNADPPRGLSRDFPPDDGSSSNSTCRRPVPSPANGVCPA